MSHWIVVALFTDDVSDGTHTEEEWHVYESYDDALTAYDILIENGVYSASVCAVVKSTDYDSHPEFREYA